MKVLHLIDSGGLYGAEKMLLAPARCIHTLAWTGHKREAGNQSLFVIYSIPYYFMLLNMASYKACVGFLKVQKKVTWNPRKG